MIEVNRKDLVKILDKDVASFYEQYSNLSKAIWERWMHYDLYYRDGHIARNKSALFIKDNLKDLSMVISIFNLYNMESDRSMYDGEIYQVIGE